MKVTFEWREWWEAERFGVIYTTLLCALCAVASVYVGEPKLSLLFAMAWVFWVGVWCAGWQLLCFGIAKLRLRMGWFTYHPDGRDRPAPPRP